MPYLKQKINSVRAKMPAEEFSDDEEVLNSTAPQSPLQPIPIKQESLKPIKAKKEKKALQPKRATKRDSSQPSSKNIVKNFGKAMCTFASSNLSMPYLEQINQRYNINIDAFQDHIHSKRDLVDSISSVRVLFLITDTDIEEVAKFKQIFQEVSIIFLKYFSVNWIFQGKMSHKNAHLKSRFKMIRRIKEPQYFTYFKDFSK